MAGEDADCLQEKEKYCRSLPWRMEKAATGIPSTLSLHPSASLSLCPSQGWSPAGCYYCEMPVGTARAILDSWGLGTPVDTVLNRSLCTLCSPSPPPPPPSLHSFLPPQPPDSGEKKAQLSQRVQSFCSLSPIAPGGPWDWEGTGCLASDCLELLPESSSQRLLWQQSDHGFSKISVPHSQPSPC